MSLSASRSLANLDIFIFRYVNGNLYADQFLQIRQPRGVQDSHDFGSCEALG